MKYELQNFKFSLSVEAELPMYFLHHSGLSTYVCCIHIYLVILICGYQQDEFRSIMNIRLR